MVSNILYFHPWGRWTQFDEHIFQMGWFNHQLDKVWTFALLKTNISPKNQRMKAFLKKNHIWWSLSISGGAPEPADIQITQVKQPGGAKGLEHPPWFFGGFQRSKGNKPKDIIWCILRRVWDMNIIFIYTNDIYIYIFDIYICIYNSDMLKRCFFFGMDSTTYMYMQFIWVFKVYMIYFL